MQYDTNRRAGGWCVELIVPITGEGGRQITQIELVPPTMDQMIRWGRKEIPSSLALMAELCNVQERYLRNISSIDNARVWEGWLRVVPPDIRTDFQKGTVLLATPDDQLPPSHRPAPLNPLFPAPREGGPVEQFPEHSARVETPEDGIGIDTTTGPAPLKAVK